jgi:hypothetical protein
MPDFKKTKLLFEEQGLMKFWKRPGELLDDELFAQKVQHPNGKYIQIADLPVEYRKSEIDPNNKYPIRYVLQIKRIKRHDGSEWLSSSGSIVGLDRAGNEVPHSFYNPEKYYKPITRYSLGRRIRQTSTLLVRGYVLKLGLMKLTINTLNILYRLTRRTLTACTPSEG